jgi:hypothetical protein
MPSSPPRSSVPKRPWYLVAALVAGVVFGTSAMSDGCLAIDFYRGAPVHVDDLQGITDSAERAALIAAGDQIVDTMVLAKNRLLPLGIASLLLGAAMVIFSVRAMSGSNGARSTLVQVVLVQALVLGGGYFLRRDIQRSQMQYAMNVYHARMHETDPKVREQSERIARLLVKAGPPVSLAFQCMARLFIVVALTRPRSREFYAAAAGYFSER